MKVGDKILCIKDHSFGMMDFTKKDKNYKILEIYEDHDDIVIRTTIESGETNWSTSKSGAYYLFSDFFINLNDLRKQKLEKLNEIKTT